MPLLTRLLNGDRTPAPKTDDQDTLPTQSVNPLFAELGEGFVKQLHESFNPSQVEAIKAAATNLGFTLVKGPPGTGKTTTLKGLLNSIHLREYQRFYKSVLRIAQMEDGDTDKAWMRYKEQKPHILVTAPSNVAVDNIVLRIMEDGFMDGQGRRYNPPMVRMGRQQSERVRAVSLDSQADQLMVERDQQLAQCCIALRMEIQQMRQALGLARSRLLLLCKTVPKQLPFGWQARVDNAGVVEFFAPSTGESSATFPAEAAGTEDGEEIETSMPAGMTLEQLPEHQRCCGEVTSLVEGIETKSLQVSQMEIRLQGVGPDTSVDRLRSELETNILDTAHLIFTTLNTAGSTSVLQGAKFHVIVVDEAAQAIEPSTLIPLQTGATTCVLVGDPQQLPATVFSNLGASTAFERSLFERLEHCGHRVHLLDTQYRMHPAISAFPRKHFYGSLLKDGLNVQQPSFTRPWHKLLAFQPFTFLDLRSDTDKSNSGTVSYRNSAEARLIVNMYLTLKKYSGEEIKGKTGVITPYALQLSELNSQFQRAIGPSYADEVELNTVDGFQGKEKDVIMFSCVRAGGTKGIGFLADVRRLNVGLTRGKLACLVVGRKDTLAKNRHWKSLLEHAAQTRSIVGIQHANCDLLSLGTIDGSPVDNKLFIPTTGPSRPRFVPAMVGAKSKPTDPRLAAQGKINQLRPPQPVTFADSRPVKDSAETRGNLLQPPQRQNKPVSVATSSAVPMAVPDSQDRTLSRQFTQAVQSAALGSGSHNALLIPGKKTD